MHTTGRAAPGIPKGAQAFRHPKTGRLFALFSSLSSRAHRCSGSQHYSCHKLHQLLNVQLLYEINSSFSTPFNLFPRFSAQTIQKHVYTNWQECAHIPSLCQHTNSFPRPPTTILQRIQALHYTHGVSVTAVNNHANYPKNREGFAIIGEEMRTT
jgi:hypothetical protein